jgi:hypothetical protein
MHIRGNQSRPDNPAAGPLVFAFAISPQEF